MVYLECTRKSQCNLPAFSASRSVISSSSNCFSKVDQPLRHRLSSGSLGWQRDLEVSNNLLQESASCRAISGVSIETAIGPGRFGMPIPARVATIRARVSVNRPILDRETYAASRPWATSRTFPISCKQRSVVTIGIRRNSVDDLPNPA